jgi:hypothetical protein
MATCPFCAAELAVTRKRQVADLDLISNDLEVSDFVCPAGGSRFRYESVPRIPRGTEQWTLLLEDGREVCLPGERVQSEEERGFLRCFSCAHAGARPICTKEHVSADGQPLPAVAGPVEGELAVESLELEGVVVDVEVTRYRCRTHGDLGRAHSVIRRQPGP